ncbi:MAG TPA: abortive infection family protein [Xanthobacteraceae bacterium]|nr:abortive infection family protein [Xanthobacteraceae bacterium]
MQKIPPSIIGTVTPILADAYTHSDLDFRFMAAGFPGEPPAGNKHAKVRSWLVRANNECQNPLALLRQLLAEYMDTGKHPLYLEQQGGDPREKFTAALAKEGLSYQRGGAIMGTSLSAPSRSLAERIAAEPNKAVEIEYDRAYKSVEGDPEAAVTAACSILESVCKVYLESVGAEMPSKQVLGQLWSATANHLGLSPKLVADNDLKRILQGLYSIADGVAALRTHEGSAHGRSEKAYRIAPRHARLAVHAAHTMALFILETWQARREERHQ